MHALFLIGRDFTAGTPIGNPDLGVAVDVAHEADAPRAQDAPVAIEHQRRSEIDIGLDALAIERAARKLHAAALGAEFVREVLERTFAALVAHRTIERMVDQQELEYTGARFHDIRCLGVDDHAVSADSRARRLQLGHLLDLDDADPAGPVDAEAGMVAVVRKLDAVLDGGLKDRLALLDREFPPVDSDLDRVHSRQF